MNITQLREVITELLSASPNLIGTYTLPNNSTIPAVYVVGPQSVPKEWKVKGLEVAIRQFPQLAPTSPLGGTVKVTQIWEVILTQFTPSGTQMAAAMDRMVRRFPDATPRYFQGDDIAYERCRFLIPDLILRNLIAS